MEKTKEAIAIVLDVGPSMNQAPPGCDTSLQTAISTVTMIMQRKLFAKSTDEVALVLFGTPDTANDLAADDSESYQNITLARHLGAINWEVMEYVQKDIQSSDINGDFLDAIVVAMDHLHKATEGKKGFTSKRIILCTDLGGEFGDDQLDMIINGLKKSEIELNVIGPSLNTDEDDDAKPGPSNGHPAKQKTPQQNAGEKLIKYMMEQVNVMCYSFSEVIPMLSFFQSRAVKPTAWKVTMDIGCNLQIPVCGYVKVKEQKAASFKPVYARDASEKVNRSTSHHLNDENETEIESSDIAKGLRYGNTLVPFSADDEANMKFKATKGFKILGFTKAENVKRHHFLGDSVMCFVGEKEDHTAQVALSAFINALYETNSVAIVRRVYSAATTPRLGFLSPHIKATYECLHYSELPFREDLRQFTFNPLPVNDDPTFGKQFKPSGDQLSAMDDLITKMDLTNAEEEEEGDSEEALKPKNVFNPHLQRLYQCLQSRALNPDDPLPELPEVIARALQPPAEIQTRCAETRENLQKLFKLEFIKPKADDAKQNLYKDVEDTGPPSKKIKVDDNLGSGMSDLTKGKVTEVGTVSPVEDFQAMLSSRDSDMFDIACRQMQGRIKQLVMDSFGNQFYPKAMQCAKVLRAECIKNKEPNMFNNYLKQFRDTLTDNNRNDFWDLMVTDHFTLIDKSECEDSGLSKQDADDFLKAVVTKDEEPEVEDSADADDLLMQM